ncbi:MAG: DUF971 domain-containing protein [Acidobacteriota bacterium]|nr:DUF971 domain-containing protein [Acidobacteriota bacterium]
MIEPTNIVEESDSALSITWSNQTDSKYNAAQLRMACPCASCVNEWTGEKILKDENVSDNVRFATVALVGRYALNFQFSDGHNTGIYSFRYLLQLSNKKN